MDSRERVAVVGSSCAWLARRDPGSAGVNLTTEDAANVPLYRHFRYRCVGSVRVAPRLESWSFFRPREPSG